MWHLVQRMVRTPILNLVRQGSRYEKPPPDIGTQIYQYFKKNSELIPILGIAVIPMSFAVYHLVHALNTKGDVRANKCKRMIPPHEEIGPTQKTKMYTRHPENYLPIPELEAIRNDLAKDEIPNKPC